ncbi:MAG: enoyl-ACP reductase [Chloroflexi bacterium]|nr:enoyl-ACP reductase [Chloroflexota bacterium]MQC26400.1 enoyl-ACP reductase [Chloroflexota bacterium]
MKLLEGKKALVFGVANDRSIAWGIAKAFHEHGANVGLSYAGGALEKRVRPLAEEINSQFLEICDVGNDEEIAGVAEKAKKHFGEIDILVHSIAFANRDELKGNYYDTSREGFHLAMDVSVYSFTALASAFQPIISRGGSLMTMTYHGSQKAVPSYNVMGVAKAALESSVRYLARDFGPDKIRVNAISAGAIRTLAAAGVSGVRSMISRFAELSPLRENVTADDVGNAAVFLASDLSRRITGEILYVDSGFNILGIASDDEGSK